jgi:hypothetical protein
MTVYQRVEQWAAKNQQLINSAAPLAATKISKHLQTFYKEWTGIETKRWLFVFSPESANPLLEVHPHSLITAIAKCGTMEENGGILVGADFSEGWATPACNGKIQPLLVVGRGDVGQATTPEQIKSV